MPDEQQLLDLIASNSQGILAGVTRAGYPHLTNVLYVWDAAELVARVSTTADRVKGRILRRNPRGRCMSPDPTSGQKAVRRPAGQAPRRHLIADSTKRSPTRLKTAGRGTEPSRGY
jgi:hypothetical protein